MRLLKIFFLFITVSSLHAQIDLLNGIVVSFPFTNGSTNDFGPNSLNGALFGNVTVTNDRLGNPNNAFDFGGTNSDYIIVNHDPLLNFSNQSFSVSAWAYRTRVTFNGMLVYKGGDIVDGYGLRVNADGNGQDARFRLGNPSRWFFDADDIKSPPDIQNFVWTHYTGVYDAPTQTMYIYEDGKLASQKTIAVGFSQFNTLPLTIGQHSAASRPVNATALYPFAGKIDDVIIYNKALNSCEVYVMGGDVSTCIGIDEGLRLRMDFCGNMNDASGNGNNGTAPWYSYFDDKDGNAFSALTFVGTSSVLGITENVPLDFGSGSFAISAWFKTNNSSTVQRIVSNGFESFSDGYQLAMNVDSPGTISFGIGNGGNASASVSFSTINTFADNLWHHVVVNIDRSKNKIWMYVDRRKQDLVKTSSTPTAGNFLSENKDFDINSLTFNATSPNPFIIGGKPDNSEKFLGAIDNIRIYNRSIIPGEAKFLYSITSAGNCCPGIPPPSTNNFSVCGIGSSIVATVSGGYGYRWYNASVGGAIVSNSETYTTHALNKNDTLYISNAYGLSCESMTRNPLIIYVYTIPSAPVLSSNQSICGPSLITVSGIASGSIKWYNSSLSGTVLGLGSNFSANISVSSVFFANQIDGFNCISPFSNVSVEIVPKPALPSISGDSSVCPNNTNVGYKTITTSGLSYKWFVNGGTVIGGNISDTLNVNWGGSNPTAKVKLVSRNNVGCNSDTLSFNVRINQFISTETPTGVDSVCFLSANNLQYQVTASSGSVFTWTVVNATKSSDQNHKITISPSTSGIIKMSVLETVTTSSDVCKKQSDTLYVKVWQNPDPNAQISGLNQICKSTISNYVLRSLSNTTVQWSANQGNLTTTSISMTGLSFNNPGNYTLTGIETTNKGCNGGSINKLIKVDIPYATSIINQNTDICYSFPQVYNYTASGFSGSAFNWSVSGNSINIINGQGTSVVGIQAIGTGTGFVKVTETTTAQNACSLKTDSVRINLFKTPDSTITLIGPDSICQSNTKTLFLYPKKDNVFVVWNGISSMSGGNMNFSYGYPNTISSVSLNLSLTGTMLIQYQPYYNHSITSGLKQCYSKSLTKKITVLQKPITSSISGNSLFCRNNLANAIFSVAGMANSTYSWQIIGGNNSINEGKNTSVIKSNLDSIVNNKIIKVVETNTGCKGDTVYKNVALDLPISILKYVSTNEINENKIEINLQPINKQSILLKNDVQLSVLGLNTTIASDVYNLNDSISNSYQLRLTDNCGLSSNSDIHKIVNLKGNVLESTGEVNLEWTPYIGWKQNIDKYEILRKIGQTGSWEVIETNTPNILVFNRTVATDGILQFFRIKAYRSSVNQFVSFSNIVELKFENTVKVWTGFTPNGDDKNKTFYIERINLYPNNKLTVFDKWGNVVYEKENYNNDWDGTFNGKDVPSGSYYFLLDLKNKEKPIGGTLVLVR
ncbi:MAG: LamG-like jellyroll fold domain-containing protein [Bacteroidota bacterium]|nr:LamG-like jellyroll fold domain-containing protein [Bacteroidota bacterium]